MSQEQAEGLTFDSYMAEKRQNPEGAPVNHPSTRYQGLIEDVINSTGKADSGISRLDTAINSAKNHCTNIIDQYEAVQRLSSNIKNKAFKEKFNVVIASMKKECNSIQAQLDKAKREGSEIKATIKSLGLQAKHEKASSRSATWRNASIVNLKQPLIELAQRLSLSTVEHPVEESDRLELREYIVQFRLTILAFL